MSEIICIALFGWLFLKTIGIIFKLTWGIGKAIATILCLIALPIMIIGLVITSALYLFLPIVLIAGALYVLKTYAS